MSTIFTVLAEAIKICSGDSQATLKSLLWGVSSPAWTKGSPLHDISTEKSFGEFETLHFYYVFPKRYNVNTAALSHNKEFWGIKRTERNINYRAMPVKIEPFDFDNYFDMDRSFGCSSHDFYEGYGCEGAYSEDISL